MSPAPLVLLAGLAAGQEGGWTASWHGDVKSFGLALLPYDHVLMGTTWEPRCLDSPLLPPDLCVPDLDAPPRRIPPRPAGQGIWNLRLKGRAAWKDVVILQAHHVIHSTLGSLGDASLQGFGTGVGLAAPEAVDLSWSAPLEGEELTLAGYTDRLSITVRQPGLEATLGRQPVSFGTGLFFTPLDLVNPFTPTTIDTEYKPGVDALRLDAFFGTGGRITAVAAQAGAWTADGMVFAAQGQGTVGVTDLGGFLGLVHGEPVLGLSTAGAVGPVGVHGDLALTLPADEAPFVRGVAGTDWRPTGTTTLSAEGYVQTFGTTDPDRYLVVALDDRFARGEVWTFGLAYGGLAWSQEWTGLLTSQLALIANLTDPSAMVAPGLDWSIAENASLGIGGFAGIGARPDRGVRPEDLVDPACLATATDPAGCALTGPALARAMGLNSEFGAYPVVLFSQFKAYF